MYVLLRSLVLVVLASCSSSSGKSHVVNMPLAFDDADPPTEHGKVSLVFSKQATNVVVAINGILVVERDSAKRILIAGVESGYANLSIAADGVERSAKIWIDSGRTTSVPVGNPGSPPERLNPLATTALSIVAFLISRAATDYLF